MAVSIRVLYKSNMKSKPVPRTVPSFALYGQSLEERFPDGLHIETIRARSTIHDWIIRPHRHHDLQQLFWIAKGGGAAQIEGEEHALRPETAMIAPPLTVHGFSFEPDTSGFVVSIPVKTLERALGNDAALYAALEVPAIATLRGSAIQAGEIELLMQSALQEFRRDAPGRRSALFAHAALIALWFVRAQAGEVVPESRIEVPGSRVVRRYLSLIENSFRSHQSLKVYAKQLNVSVPHLSRVCRRVAGVSALKLLHNRILLEARRNLVYTTMPISQMAFSLGFSDPAYFTRFFTEKTGQTPSACRANVLSLVSNPAMHLSGGAMNASQTSKKTVSFSP